LSEIISLCVITFGLSVALQNVHNFGQVYIYNVLTALGEGLNKNINKFGGIFHILEMSFLVLNALKHVLYDTG
jgi:hypothetical protein